MTTKSHKQFLIAALLLFTNLAFGQATIFVPADNAVRAQKPNFQILEDGTGGQVFEFAIPSLASSLKWTMPSAYCSAGQGISFFDGTGTLQCQALYQPGNFTTSYVLFGDGDSIPATSNEFQFTSGATSTLTIGNATAGSNGLLTIGGGSGTATIAAPGGVLDFNGTGAIKVPVGTTAQQPGSPVNGLLRYNLDADSFEGYINGVWGAIGGGGGLITSVSDTDSIDLTETAGDLTADLNLSVAAPDAGNINSVNSIETDGLQVQVPILVGDSGSGGVAGVVPAPASGDAAADKFLKADGTWETVTSGIAGFTANSDTTLSALDNLAIGTTAADTLQHWRVKGNSGAALLGPTTPFGAVAPVDRTLVCLMGVSDADPVTVGITDSSLGFVGNGEVTLGQYDSACFRYLSTEDRFVLESRSN